jgi:lipopolysaccharide/colanic/teichoic acid biosynthesis glycosyltransferase
VAVVAEPLRGPHTTRRVAKILSLSGSERSIGALYVPLTRLPLRSAELEALTQPRPARGLLFEAHISSRRHGGMWWKRSLDIAGAFLLLIVFAPVMAGIAIAIKLESTGPAVLGQERVGRRLRPFRIYKFRSMVDGADRMLPRLEHLSEVQAPMFKLRQDPRVTRVGRFIRRHSLDELPQLLNVVRGEMSLVGPRPPLAREVEHDLMRQKLRLELRPGITGLWQVSGRSGVPYDTMVRLDIQYGDRCSLLLDIRILLQTIPAVLFGRGAF